MFWRGARVEGRWGRREWLRGGGLWRGDVRQMGVVGVTDVMDGIGELGVVIVRVAVEVAIVVVGFEVVVVR